MSEELYKELNYNFEKEKFEFMSKYYLLTDITKEQHFIILEEVKQLIKRMEDYIKEVEVKYNLNDYEFHDYQDYFDYLYFNEWLDTYSLYREFIDGLNENLDYFENYEGLEKSIELVNFVSSAFSRAHSEVSDHLNVSLDFIKGALVECETISRGVYFMGEEANKMADEMAEALSFDYMFEVDFSKPQVDYLAEVLQFLGDSSATNYYDRKVIILKNIGVAIDDSKLRTSLLSFFSELYSRSEIIILCTSSEMYPFSVKFELIKDISQIKYKASKNACRFYYF